VVGLQESLFEIHAGFLGITYCAVNIFQGMVALPIAL
jgi:hypothetical protein